MSSTMANVDQRTQLAGRNRFEMLLFFMGRRRRFGINVFKVREVIPAPRITPMPDTHSAVRGIAHVRGQTIAMIDLCFATSGRPLPADKAASVIVTEYNRTTQGFLVEGVDRIQNVNWQDVMPPPERIANRAYLTAVTEIESELVQIVDVEKVLAEITAIAVGAAQVETSAPIDHERDHLLVVDDSLVARNQIRRALEPAGWEVTVARNGQEALELLQGWAAAAESRLPRTAVVISDIEMPRMDGYALASAIREDERLCHLRVLLHTSLSGMSNRSMIEQVGADDFLPKFDASELAARVSALLAC